MKAEDHFIPVAGERRSLVALRVKASALVEKVSQGEVRTRPRMGEGSVSGVMVPEGCGCWMWERRARHRFAPALSPVRIMFWGDLWSLLMTWSKRAAACWSWRG
jgi:hypothetical protein